MSTVSFSVSLESLKGHLISKAKEAGLNPPDDKNRIYLTYDYPYPPGFVSVSYGSGPSGLKLFWQEK